MIVISLLSCNATYSIVNVQKAGFVSNERERQILISEGNDFP